MKLHDTPIETYKLHGVKVDVKREDLCTRYPAPPFSKVRGLMLHLKKLKADGITTIGYVETSISMAGWGVAYCCHELGLQAVIYKPIYKQEPRMLTFHARNWANFPDTIIEEVPAGMARVNYNICRKRFLCRYPSSGVMLDLGLPLPETIEATAAISKKLKGYKSIVVNIGSGTICAGIMKGLPRNVKVYGILGRTSDVEQKQIKMMRKGGFLIGGFFGKQLELVDEGWEYTQRSYVSCPFPCHPYYDLKAWEWLIEKVHSLPKPILFWNIGSMRRNK